VDATRAYLRLAVVGLSPPDDLVAVHMLTPGPAD
jgi:hypothetical protein